MFSEKNVELNKELMARQNLQVDWECRKSVPWKKEQIRECVLETFAAMSICVLPTETFILSSHKWSGILPVKEGVVLLQS